MNLYRVAIILASRNTNDALFKWFGEEEDPAYRPPTALKPTTSRVNFST